MELPNVSPSELEVLKALWAGGPSTVRQVWERLPEGKWVYTTVQTLLQRLEGKGFVGSHKRERVRVYMAAVTREDLLQERLGTLSRELCDGSSVPLMRGLVSGRGLSSDEIRELRSMLDALEGGDSASPEGGRKKT